MIKKAHFYWGNRTISFLRYMTLRSFIQKNPDWEVFLWVPTIYGNPPTWRGHENKLGFHGRDYTKELHQLTTPIPINFDPIGFNNQASEVFKSDYLRWFLLQSTGGLWLDMDILFTGPIPELSRDSVTYNPLFNVYYIAFLYSEHAEYWKATFENCLKAYDPRSYQSLGWEMFAKYRDIRIKRIDPKIILPVERVTKIPTLFRKNGIRLDRKKTCGIHWFGGFQLSAEWENHLTHETVWDFNSPLFKEIQRCLESWPISPMTRDTKEKQRISVSPSIN